MSEGLYVHGTGMAFTSRNHEWLNLFHFLTAWSAGFLQGIYLSYAYTELMS